jgi:uncharacterized membrane protein
MIDHSANKIRANFLHERAWKEFMALKSKEESKQNFTTEARIIG